MSTEIISAIIGVASVIISGVVSWLVSKASASKEIEKLKMEWAREDRKAADDEFADMVVAVSCYINMPDPATKARAIEAVAALRAKESGLLASYLDVIYNYITIANCPGLDGALTGAIQEKRDRKSRQNAECGEQPAIK